MRDLFLGLSFAGDSFSGSLLRQLGRIWREGEVGRAMIEGTRA